MKEKIQSIETQIALIQSDIHSIKNRSVELPEWLKNSAAATLMAMITQIMISVWWASSLTTQLHTIKQDVRDNTEFRTNWAEAHAEVMVNLKELQTDNKHMTGMLKEVKNKLRFVDLKQQVK